MYTNTVPRVRIPLSAPEKNPHLSTASVGSFQRNKSLAGFVKYALRVKYLLRKCEMPAGMSGFISFHIATKEQYFTMTTGHYFTSEGYFTLTFLTIVV